jgi:hypothetical protein
MYKNSYLSFTQVRHTAFARFLYFFQGEIICRRQTLTKRLVALSDRDFRVLGVPVSGGVTLGIYFLTDHGVYRISSEFISFSDLRTLRPREEFGIITNQSSRPQNYEHWAPHTTQTHKASPFLSM